MHSETVFPPYVGNQLSNVERVDAVWDRYLPSSIKDSAQSKRGNGIRRRVRSDTRIPGDWTAFLRVDEKKQELSLYLAEQLTTMGTDHGELVSTKHETVAFNSDRSDRRYRSITLHARRSRYEDLTTCH